MSVVFEHIMCIRLDSAHKKVVCSSFDPPQRLCAGCRTFVKQHHDDGLVTNSKDFSIEECEDPGYWAGWMQAKREEEKRTRKEPPECRRPPKDPFCRTI